MRLNKELEQMKTNYVKEQLEREKWEAQSRDMGVKYREERVRMKAYKIEMKIELYYQMGQHAKELKGKQKLETEHAKIKGRSNNSHEGTSYSIDMIIRFKLQMLRYSS